MEFKDFIKQILEQERAKSKRQKYIEKHGVDPKTISHYGGQDHGGTHVVPLELSERTRTRGGKNSRRRTARVWQPVK